jgi:hypothetical protein
LSARELIVFQLQRYLALILSCIDSFKKYRDVGVLQNSEKRAQVGPGASHEEVLSGLCDQRVHAHEKFLSGLLLKVENLKEL